MTCRLHKLHSICDRQGQGKPSVGRVRRHAACGDRTVLHKQIFSQCNKFFVPARGVEDVTPYRRTDCFPVSLCIKNSSKAEQTLIKSSADPAAPRHRGTVPGIQFAFGEYLRFCSVPRSALRYAKVRLRHFATNCEIPALRMTQDVKSPAFLLSIFPNPIDIPQK